MKPSKFTRRRSLKLYDRRDGKSSLERSWGLSDEDADPSQDTFSGIAESQFAVLAGGGVADFLAWSAERVATNWDSEGITSSPCFLRFQEVASGVIPTLLGSTKPQRLCTPQFPRAKASLSMIATAGFQQSREQSTISFIGSAVFVASGKEQTLLRSQL